MAEVSRAQISRSFSLGWEVTSLYAELIADVETPPPDAGPSGGSDLPALDELPAWRRVELHLDEIDAAVHDLGAAQVLGPSAEAAATAAARELLDPSAAGAFGDELYIGDLYGQGSTVVVARGDTALARSIRSLHTDLLTGLSASSRLLGRAYRLGQALATTCAARQSPESLARELDPERLEALRRSVADLTSVLPDHAAGAVEGSLDLWRAWVAERQLPSLSTPELAQVAEALHAQGGRWRALLAGEQDPTSTLEVRDHITIARRSLAESSGLGVGVAQSLWVLWVPALVVFGLGVGLVVAFGGVAHVVTGLIMILVALVAACACAAAVLRQVGHRVSDAIWGAECDRAAAERVTLLPPIERPEVPAPHHSRAHRPPRPPRSSGRSMSPRQAAEPPPVESPVPRGGPGEVFDGEATQRLELGAARDRGSTVEPSPADYGPPSPRRR